VSGTIARIDEGRSALKTVLAAAVATLEIRLGYSTRAAVWSKARVCSNNLQLANTPILAPAQGEVSLNAAGFRLLEEVRTSRAATTARRRLRRRLRPSDNRRPRSPEPTAYLALSGRALSARNPNIV
jgi:hypothetical protein